MRTTLTENVRTTVFLLGIVLAVQGAQAQQQYTFNTREKEGYQIKQQTSKSIFINYSVSRMTTENRMLDGNMMQNISLSGVFLPNEAGAPDLPNNLRYIAIPQGAKATLKIVSAEKEIINNMEIAPAPVIPLDEISKIGEPMVYKKDETIYSTNAFYPEQPVKISETMQIRGIDVVELGISPFQYNPVTKELIVYKNLELEITYEGGTERFGEDAYRSRWWEPILEDVILNYSQLPRVDYNAYIQKALEDQSLSLADQGCEYAIIVPITQNFRNGPIPLKNSGRNKESILKSINFRI